MSKYIPSGFIVAILATFLILTLNAGPNAQITSNETSIATTGGATTFTVASTKICECATVENLSTTAGEYFTLSVNGGTAFRMYAGASRVFGCDGVPFLINKFTHTAGSGTPVIQIVAFESAR